MIMTYLSCRKNRPCLAEGVVHALAQPFVSISSTCVVRRRRRDRHAYCLGVVLFSYSLSRFSIKAVSNNCDKTG